MSEKAVGYTTIGGDLEGALSVIANVPKTVVDSAAATACDTRFGFAGIETLPGHAARSRAGRRARWPNTS